jgi:hypothetical protein
MSSSNGGGGGNVMSSSSSSTLATSTTMTTTTTAIIDHTRFEIFMDIFDALSTHGVDDVHKTVLYRICVASRRFTEQEAKSFLTYAIEENLIESRFRKTGITWLSKVKKPRPNQMKEV